MNISMAGLLKGIDRKAWFPLAYLIYSYLQNHKIVGDVGIYENGIYFSKAIFFARGKIDYEPYGIECRDGVLFYDGGANFKYPTNSEFFIFLVNAIRVLRPGYYVPFKGRF